MSAPDQDPIANNGDDKRATLVDRKHLAIILLVIAAGLVAIPIYAIQAPSLRTVASIIAVGMVTAGASILIGGLLGLLFGIPRRLQSEHLESADESARPDESGPGNRALYSGNTNLEQISDWLTKILVGVGLTQIGQIDDLFDSIGDVAGKGMGDLESSYAFSIALILYFTVSGFLLGYLWTRLYLGRALTVAERTYSLEKKLSKLERQSYADAAALRRSSEQLTGDEATRPTQSAVDAAIKEASPETRSHIFYRAQLQRWRNWREPLTKPMMERSIPIFRALVASDEENRYHANHGQLGFALKDRRNPDWKAAEEALSRAIAIRGDARTNGWHSYEFNRALCRIMQDQAFQQDKPSSGDIAQAVVSDLETANADEWVAKWIRDDDAIKKWLGLNKVKLRS